MDDIMDTLLIKFLQKTIPYLGITILLTILLTVVIFFGRLFILYHTSQNMKSITTEVLRDQTIYFNTEEKIKYRHLSREFKKNVRQEDFNSIETWHDAYEVFVEGVDETHSRFSDGYKPYASVCVLETKGLVSINLVESCFGFLGVRIDYINICPSYLEHLTKLED
ncbi:hypothetical protein RBH29_04015 [Herbivorax sp. ANBcel31]|uniref:hypothetical protein n=1 Tax=Herbivorax sp. ANBcel31 TaxID=3069754 RepID=UPI0027AFCAA8|nr:hypothetical protein [Herbivorax sp. ANBcel31]MDQ2085599.1 hypothetical protein [Herbivorax sp. ANBcel31]